MSKTIDDLKTAFAGESQAFQKYTAYAKKAAAQGFTNIAKLFEATAQAELIHAAGHLKTLDQIQDTLDNLQDAINGETYEFTEMYPPMLQTAEAENHKAKVAKAKTWQSLISISARAAVTLNWAPAPNDVQFAT